MIWNRHGNSGHRATVFLSALLLWCAGALSLLNGVPSTGNAANDPAPYSAARSGDLPTQHSTPAARHVRHAVLTERLVERDSGAAHHAGPDTAILVSLPWLFCPVRAETHLDTGNRSDAQSGAAWFQARAPPILS